MTDEPKMEQLPEAEETPWQMFDSRQIHSSRRMDDGTVQVRFKDKKTGGYSAEYHYTGIPEDLYEAFRTADSVGEFFSAHIKPNKDFAYRKQPPPEE